MQDPIIRDRMVRAAQAAEQLCAALWEALQAEAAAGHAHSVAALSERLAEVSRSVTVLVTAGEGSPGGGPVSPEGGREPFRPAEGPPVTGRWREEHAYRPERPPPEAQEPARESRSASLIDEGGSGVFPEREIGPQRMGEAGMQAIEARDVRRTEPSAWETAVQRRLERFAEDGTPFSLLLVEVLDAARLRLAQPPEEAERLTHRIETAIASVLRPADSLLRETDGRYWLIAPDTGASVARPLAEQIAAAAGSSGSHRGAPIRVTVGIAVCPEHGREVDALIGHADMNLYAAQAAGRSIGGLHGFDGDFRLG